MVCECRITTYKSLREAVMISATLVNTDTQTAFDGYTISSASCDIVDRTWRLSVVVASVIHSMRFIPHENETYLSAV